jgi:RNA polymerase sigma factor (sigma-70 family)
MTASFQGLLEAHYSRVLRAALGMLGDRESAREAAQEAMTKAYAARDRYDHSQPFYPWMYRIVRNTCLDIRARQRIRRTAPLDEGRVVAGGVGPERAAAREEEAALLWRAMSGLSAEHQEILNLRHFQDLSYAEIAQLLGVAEGTVMSRLYRARKALAAAMREA